MNIYECSEDQFIENVRRLIDAGNKIVVNRRVTNHDDHRYGLSTLPDEEFERYSMISYRGGYKHTTYAKVPFVDDTHKHLYNENDVLHSSNSLLSPRLSIPYYRVDYSFNLWGSMYIHTFDILFDAEIRLEKRRIRGSNQLVHILYFNPPDERMLLLKLPDHVIVLDIKKLTRIFDRD